MAAIDIFFQQERPSPMPNFSIIFDFESKTPYVALTYGYVNGFRFHRLAQKDYGQTFQSRPLWRVADQPVADWAADMLEARYQDFSQAKAKNNG